MATAEKEIRRLKEKVQVLETMLEERSREDYIANQRREIISALLSLSLRGPSLTDLLETTLDILLSHDFLCIENKGCIFLADSDRKELTLAASLNLDATGIEQCATVPYGQCLCGKAIRMEEIVVAGSSEECSDFSGRNVPLHGHCCLPLIHQNIHLGVLCLYLPHNVLLSKEQRDFLAAAADILTGAIQRTIDRDKIASYQADLEELVARKIDELAQAEKRYSDIFRNAPSGLFQVSEEGRFYDCNPAMARMLAYDSPEELMQARMAQELYVDPDDRGRLFDALQKGPVAHFITRLLRKDGRLLWAQIAVRRLENEYGTVLQGSVIDISRRKEAEQALEAEKERLLVTLRSIGDGVVSTDAEGRVTLLNKVAESLTGWSLAEALGRPLGEVFHIINEKTRKLCVNPVEKVLATGEIVGLANHTALISKDGTERSIADSGAPIRNHNSEIVGVVLVFRDVTEAYRLEAELQKKRQLESLGVLAGGIAHDFNNILTAILGNINLVQFLVEPESKAGRLLDQAEKASRRAASLVQQLLTFSKGGDPIRQTASITEIIQVTTDFILRGSSVSCAYDFAEDLWLADVDSGQVSQVVQNLVINAKQAMPEGGTLSIRCSNMLMDEENRNLSLKYGRYIKVDVQDQGCGIEEEKIATIFDPYYTTKETGSGLGLAIVHSIVQKHGGDVTVSSTPGKGTIFSLYLPASLAKHMDVAPKEETQRPGKGSILIMDDDEMVCYVTQQMLVMLGYDVAVVSDGQEAIQEYRTAMEAGSAFDAVIMDLTIAGGMGGIEAIRGVLQIDPEAKALVASGYANDPVLANPRAYGFCGALVKPFQVDELGKGLAKILS